MSDVYEDDNQDIVIENNHSGVPPYLPAGNYVSNDLVKMAMTSYDLMDDLKVNLLGLEWNPKYKRYMRSKEIKPLITEEGAWKVITIVSSIVNRNTHLSIINDEEEINAWAREVEDNLCNDFFDNYDRYWNGVDGGVESNWPIVQNMAGNFVKLALKRAIHGREKDILAGNTKTLIQKSEMESSQRISQNQSAFSGFNIFKGGR